jgi:hypothetical protein
MNIASNPWSFVSTDVASSTAAASPTGMIQQGTTPGGPGLGSVLYTSTGAHNLSVGQHVTYISDTNGRFLGHYSVVAVPSATTALLANLSSPSSGSSFSSIIAASGGGTMLVCEWPWMVRAEDISIQATQAAPTAGEMILLDKNGSIVWEANITVGGGTTGPTPPAQNRGKVMWVNGLTFQSIPVGVVVLVTIN